MKRASALLMVIALTGCIGRSYHQMQTPFNDAEYASYARSGDATITAQAFLRQNGGGIVTCAGANAFLMPVTAYTVEMMGSLAHGQYMQGQEPSGVTSNWRKALRRTVCDAAGNFSFAGIPPGQWFIGTDIIWNVGYARQGGPVLQQIATSPGSHLNLVLSQSDLMY